MDLQPPHTSYSSFGIWQECNARWVIEKCHRPAKRPAWWFVSGHAFHSATEKYDLHAWEHGLPDSAETSTRFMHDLLVQEFDAEIRKNEEDEPDHSKWMRGGRVSKQFPEREAESFYRAQFPDWAAAYDHYCRTSGRVIYTIDGDQPAIELKWTAEFGGEQVVGYIDRLIVEQGMLGVLDFKSGSSDGDPTQLNLYRAALERSQFPDVPSFGAFWNPRKGTSQPPAMALDVPVEFFDQQYRAFGIQRRTGAITFRRTKDCGRCQVQHLCPAWGGPEAIYDIFQERTA